MKRTLVFVTHNKHKLQEVKDILRRRFAERNRRFSAKNGKCVAENFKLAAKKTEKAAENENQAENLQEEIEIISLDDICCTEEIAETADTLEGNARQKARYVFERFGKDCFADDTGLEVSCLDGAPGVHSARYADGVGHNSEANMQKLLREMEGKGNRNARFRTVIALIEKGKEYMFEGIVNGVIARERHGDAGFGYDPLFVPDGYAETFAQLGEDVKSQISHRARAVEALCDFLEQSDRK